MTSFLFAGTDIGQDTATRITEVLRQRTGDTPAVYEDGDVFLLSSRNHMDQGSLKVAFNGYIVDAEEEPEAEVAAAYRKHGAEFVNHVDGAFRVVLYDAEQDRFHVSADRAGRKVIYYSTGTDAFLCSSHLTPLLCHPAIDPSLNLVGVSDFLQGWSASFGGGERLIEGVQRLHPSHVLTYRGKGVFQKRVWDVYGEKRSVSDDEAADTLDRLLTEAARKLVEQVDDPLNVFLSGGFDSTFLVALLREVADRPIHTYTWGWEDDHFEAGRAMADRFGTRHTEIENTFTFPSEEELFFYEEPHNAFVRYPFHELYTDHGLRSYWTGLNSQATFPVCLKNIRKLDRVRYVSPLLKRLPTRTLKRLVGATIDYKLSKGIDVLDSSYRSTAAVIDWSIRTDDAERLQSATLREDGRSLPAALDRRWGLSRPGYQENYNYLQLRVRDTARYAYYAQDFEHYDVYGYRPLLEYSYSLPMSQKKNRRLLQRIARGRVPDRIITKGASGWDFVSDQFRKTIQENEDAYRQQIRDLAARGIVDESASRDILLPDDFAEKETGQINQMVAAYLLERWLKLFIDRDEPWRPV